MMRSYSCSFIAACSITLAACEERQHALEPVVARAEASVVPAAAIGVASQEGEGEGEGDVGTASLTLPFSGSYNGIPAAFTITQTGSGRAGHFENTSTTNPRAALTAQTAGTSNALQARSFGSGVAIRAENSGTSGAGYFAVTNPNGFGRALEAVNAGVGASLSVTATGTGNAATFATNKTANPRPTLWAHTAGTSNVAKFEVTYQSNSAPVLWLEHNGTGVALMAEQSGTSGDIALFRTNAANQARIDRNGTGFFNGGTQTGGADVAEAFEVDGKVADYRPGDVLVISAHNDRKVSRSAQPYSSRVIGVYATKPGVLLTERGIDDSLDDMIPVAVIGVLPTRVSAENGAIRRGDILVTASTPGHAMRTDPVTVQGIKLYPSGAILGKALENFAGPGTGVIRVLVNVK